MKMYEFTFTNDRGNIVKCHVCLLHFEEVGEPKVANGYTRTNVDWDFKGEASCPACLIPKVRKFRSGRQECRYCKTLKYSDGLCNPHNV